MNIPLYLIMAESGLPVRYNYLRNRNFVLLSYKEESEQTDIFSPNSTWTTGRNQLREYALRLVEKFDYYVFLDCDVMFIERTQREGFEFYEQMLLKINSPIVNPSLDFYNQRKSNYTELPKSVQKKGLENSDFDCQTVDWFDGVMNGFRRDVFFDEKIFPYLDTLDSVSWHASQFSMILLANRYYHNGIVQLNLLKVENVTKSSYPRGKDFARVMHQLVSERIGESEIKMSDGIEVFPLENS